MFETYRMLGHERELELVGAAERQRPSRTGDHARRTIVFVIAGAVALALVIAAVVMTTAVAPG